MGIFVSQCFLELQSVLDTIAIDATEWLSGIVSSDFLFNIDTVST